MRTDVVLERIYEYARGNFPQHAPAGGGIYITNPFIQSLHSQLKGRAIQFILVIQSIQLEQKEVIEELYPAK